jgi:hypothetical protein
MVKRAKLIKANGKLIFLRSFFFRCSVNGRLVKDGMGKMVWPDGSTYFGTFENDVMSGKGQMTQATGDMY